MKKLLLVVGIALLVAWCAKNPSGMDTTTPTDTVVSGSETNVDTTNSTTDSVDSMTGTDTTGTDMGSN